MSCWLYSYTLIFYTRGCKFKKKILSITNIFVTEFIENILEKLKWVDCKDRLGETHISLRSYVGNNAAFLYFSCFLLLYAVCLHLVTTLSYIDVVYLLFYISIHNPIQQNSLTNRCKKQM